MLQVPCSGLQRLDWNGSLWTVSIATDTRTHAQWGSEDWEGMIVPFDMHQLQNKNRVKYFKQSLNSFNESLFLFWLALPWYFFMSDCCTWAGLSVTMPSGRMKCSILWWTFEGEDVLDIRLKKCMSKVSSQIVTAIP